MHINRASEAQVTSPHKALRSVFKKYGHMPCKHCGSILDKNGRHTDEWVRTFQSGIYKYRSRMYRVWGAMLERCRNPNQERFSSYGGRGIKVCNEWNDFAVFRKWALSAGYAPGLQIDRKDNDRGYSPDNCRIVNRHQQQQNRRLPNRHKTGKRYGRRFLTEEDVYTIRESQLTNQVLADQFDMHNGTISNIKRRKAWTHLPERSPVERQSVN